MTKDFRPPGSYRADDAVDISGLLTPLSVGSLRPPNRFALAPMTRYATPDVATNSSPTTSANTNSHSGDTGRR